MNVIEKLKPLEKESIERGIPILGSIKGKWLYDKIVELRPRKILELGTANGYSGIILGSEGGKLLTIEINEKIAYEARKNFKKFNINAEIIINNGVEEVKRLVIEKKEFFDLVFIDFAKKDYIKILEDCIKLVKGNGFIIADNMSFGECNDYKEAVLRHPKLKTEIIRIGDWLSYSKKILSNK